MNLQRRLIIAATGIAVLAAAIVLGGARASEAPESNPDQVLDWNQIFIDTLVATNTANSSSQRLGAIVHTAIFDAYNGIERRYTPVFVQNVDAERAPRSSWGIATSSGHRLRVHRVGGSVSLSGEPAKRQVRGFARGAQ